MNLETLETAQLEMQERSRAARAKRRKAGLRKKRTRVSIKKLLVDLAGHAKAQGKVRAWAIQQLLLLGGKPVQPFEENIANDEPDTTTEPPARGSDLGAVVPRTTGAAIPVDPI